PDVKGQRLVGEVSRSVPVANQVRQQHAADARLAGEDVVEPEEWIERALEHEAVRAPLRRAGLEIHLGNLVDRRKPAWNVPPGQRERVETAPDELRDSGVELRLDRDVDVGVDEVVRGRRGIETIADVLDVRKLPLGHPWQNVSSG